MKEELIYADASRLAELIRTREASSVEVVQAHLDRIAALNPKMDLDCCQQADATRGT